MMKAFWYVICTFNISKRPWISKWMWRICFYLVININHEKENLFGLKLLECYTIRVTYRYSTIFTIMKLLWSYCFGTSYCRSCWNEILKCRTKAVRLYSRVHAKQGSLEFHYVGNDEAIIRIMTLVKFK